LFCDYDFINENGKKFRPPLIFNHQDLIKYPFKALWFGCLNGITMLIPKKAFEKCGKFDVSLRCTQDYDMWKRIIEKYNFVHVDKILTLTRLHSKQDSNVSPKVVSEGNLLWKNIIATADNKRIKNYFGDELQFYYEMYNFLKNTPYSLVTRDCYCEIERIQEERYKKLKNEKIAVIISCDSNSSNIDKLIDSVNNQTYKNIFIYVLENDTNDKLKKSLKKFSFLSACFFKK